jgi:hypothetical protein
MFRQIGFEATPRQQSGVLTVVANEHVRSGLTVGGSGGFNETGKDQRPAGSAGVFVAAEQAVKGSIQDGNLACDLLAVQLLAK